ncbi:MAG: ribulose-phosphate 3-epimerase [Actinobacteria bacterium]|nr:ribulose-phosphate 3-epimerase [Actinomycetota bacterium]
MIKKFVSLLSADASNYGGTIKKLEKEGFNGFHFDVFDGNFVKNFAFNAEIIKSLRKLTALPFNAHLAIEDPGRFLETFIEVGCDIISIHPQACKKVERDLRYIKAKNILSSVVIDPDIKIDHITNYLPIIDNIIIMTVYPGFNKQKFIASSLVKIKMIKEIITENNLNISISVDGAVDKNTSKEIIECGADILIYGSSLFNNNIN